MKNTNNSGVHRLLCRCSRYFFGFVLSSLALLAIGLLIPRKWGTYSHAHCDVDICVANRGIHSDIIVPTRNYVFDWTIYISLDRIGGIDNYHDYKYLSFGWGERDFYMTTPTLAYLNLSTTFRALFLPTPSIIYVQGYQLIPDYLEVKCIKVNQTDYLNLMEFIQATFEQDAQGRKIRLGNGHTANAGFYAAVGSYSILRNCNTWTAEGLRKADVNTPLWDGLPAGIMLHLRSSCK
ncbi:MAG: TIGR02117 family protein [Gloeotrichia echinulata IR180]|jgi:uncharacterized protein (TIGR02117 family)|nr:TIGR02117 family protein [Gloeotrichia echinulata DEX184]